MKLERVCNEELISPAPPPGWPKSMKCKEIFHADVPDDIDPDQPLHVRCAYGHRLFLRVRDMDESDTRWTEAAHA